MPNLKSLSPPPPPTHTLFVVVVVVVVVVVAVVVIFRIKLGLFQKAHSITDNRFDIRQEKLTLQAFFNTFHPGNVYRLRQ